MELPYSSHAILANRTASRIFYRVTAADGRLITGYPNLGSDLEPATSSEPRFANDTFLGVPVRTCTLGRFISGNAQSGWVTIVVAETIEDQESFAAELLRLSFGPALGLVLLTLALIWFAVRGALKPLDAIERSLVSVDPAALRTIDVPVPREISHLVSALNALIIRLTAILTRMQNFIGESAHQIRTPLSNLRAQAEVALDETNERSMRDTLRTIHHNAVAVSRLADQLLADTMVAHRGEVASLEPTDLLETVEFVVDDFVEQTGVKPVLRIDALEEAPFIEGDTLMLREAVKNLLDNARKYAGADLPITVRVTANDTHATLSIEDHGPGIPAEDRPHITDRFVRGSRSSSAPGSGLGLAIVSNVVRHHKARLELDGADGGGLIVRIIFPRIQSTEFG